MSISTITIGTNTISVVGLPATPGFRSIEFSMEDTVALVRSPFTGQTQTQSWPGADWWTATATLPPLSQALEGPWKAFLGAMRGMQNAVLLPLDPTHVQTPLSTFNPVCAAPSATQNAAGTQSLYVVDCPPNLTGLLQPGDYLQLGYRLHMVTDVVNSDLDGSGRIPIWPSLREQPANGTAINFTNPRGLFRLAQNKRGWSADYTRISSMSIALTEYR